MNQKIKVLLLEDETELRVMLVESLEMDGFMVTSCASVREAREHLKCEQFSAMVTDWNLDGESAQELLRPADMVVEPRIGFQTTAQINLPPHIVVVTGCADDEPFEAGHLSSYTVIQKPFETEMLGQVIRDLMGIGRS